jgi:hypothetical protein
VTKANTAAVIAILNVNTRCRPFVHCSPKAKNDRGATAQCLWRATVRGIAEKRENQSRAVRLAFEPDDFGQFAALKAGSETELRNIESSLQRVTAYGYSISAEIPGGTLFDRKGAAAGPWSAGKVPCSAVEIPCSLNRENRVQRIDSSGYKGAIDGSAQAIFCSPCILGS